MKNILKRLAVLLLVLTIVFSMTSCEIVFEILDILLSEDYFEEETREVEILADENRVIDPENPYSSLHSGYNFIPASNDGYVWKVKSYYDIDRAFDYAVANLLESVTIDFGSLIYGYSDVPDFFKNAYLKNDNKEMEHVNRYNYSYEGSVATFSFEYDVDTASFGTSQTKENTYENYRNGNMLLRDAADGEATRSENFDNFAINKNNNGEMAVYNSESLWWALEHNYLPVFPAKNTKAEAFYEKAKSILRKIINDDMTDYEKTLAIFEYLVDVVAYDYDAYEEIEDGDTNNVCFFLEGVFEYNRAVCDGKSKAFVMLCRMEGIECLRDFGESTSGGAGHAWNYVKIDGVWYMVDTTAGDAGVIFAEDGAKAEIVDYSYFLCAVNTYKPGYTRGKTYIYSGIWDSTLKGNNNNASIASQYYNRCDLDKYNDFYINSYDELDYIVDGLVALIDVEDDVKYTLKFDPGVTVTLSNVHTYINEALDGDDLDFAVYNYTESGYFLIIFTEKEVKSR